MKFNPFKRKSWEKAGNDIKNVVQPVVDTGKQAADAAAKAAADAKRIAEEQARAAEKATKDVAAAADKAAKDAAADADKAAKDAAKTANNVVKDINKQVLKPAGKAIVDGANEVSKQGKFASDEFTAGATVVAREMEKGAYIVRDGAVLVAEWAEANYCQIGMSIALGTIFAAMLYRPEPASIAQTSATMAPLSATAIAYLAAKETVGNVALGTACTLTAQAFVELLWLDPNIRKGVGNANKEILTYGIAFSIQKSFELAAGSFVVPQVGAAMVAGIVTSIASQLVCDGKLPTGAREWAMTGADGG